MLFYFPIIYPLFVLPIISALVIPNFSVLNSSYPQNQLSSPLINNLPSLTISLISSTMDGRLTWPFPQVPVPLNFGWHLLKIPKFNDFILTANGGVKIKGNGMILSLNSKKIMSVIDDDNSMSLDLEEFGEDNYSAGEQEALMPKNQKVLQHICQRMMSQHYCLLLQKWHSK